MAVFNKEAYIAFGECSGMEKKNERNEVLQMKSSAKETKKIT